MLLTGCVASGGIPKDVFYLERRVALGEASLWQWFEPMNAAVMRIAHGSEQYLS